MATNYPGEWEVRLNYTVELLSSVFTHQHRVSFDADTIGEVGETFSAWFPILRAGTDSNSLASLTISYFDLIQDLYHSTGVLLDAELWRYDPLSFDATWYAAASVALTGESASVNTANSQSILSFRTTLGGTMKLTFMQPPTIIGAKEVLPLTNADLDAIADFALSTGSWFKARDGGYPIAFLGHFPGQNEGTFKRRYR